MANSAHRDLPPFPPGLPLAPIPQISSQKLLAGDAQEGTRVLEATKTYGFFYLNLQDSPEGQQLLDHAEQLLDLSKRAFAHPVEEKKQFLLQKGVSLFGYKAAGTVKQTDKTARPDSTEFFNLSKDHMHGVAPSRSYPAEIEEARPLLKAFTREGHECGMVVLRELARRLGLAENSFTDLNLFDKPSGDHCRLTRKEPQKLNDTTAIGLPSHTDFGSITILFNWLGGLQVESRTEGKAGEWEWVKPMAGHAVVNLGDAMVTFTNGLLKSAKHRVVPLPGEQGELERYSVVYFVRPHDEALMKAVDKFACGPRVNVAGKFSASHNEDQVFTAGEWMRQRAIQMGS
ncbi:Clavaminate synthase-like protein [Thozetella sp. PMI_491]|nr:Clavaminate synthase-like protein [Thozetella sp. PMI_491]